MILWFRILYLSSESVFAVASLSSWNRLLTYILCSGWFGIAVMMLITSMSSPVSTGIGDDLWQVYHPNILSRPTQPGHHAWVNVMSTRDSFDHFWEEMTPSKLRPYGASYISL